MNRYNKCNTVNVCVLTTSNFAVGQDFKHDQTFEFLFFLWKNGPVIHGHPSCFEYLNFAYQIELLFLSQMNNSFFQLEFNGWKKICFYFHKNVPLNEREEREKVSSNMRMKTKPEGIELILSFPPNYYKMNRM